MGVMPVVVLGLTVCCLHPRNPGIYLNSMDAKTKAGLSLAGGLLLTYSQLKYQGINGTLFLTHPKTTMISVTSVLVYFVACDVKERLSSRNVSPIWTNIALFFTRFSGYLAFASLASVFFSNSFIFVPYFIFTPAVIELLYFIYSKIRQWQFQEKVALVLQFFTGLWRRIVEFGQCTTNEMNEGFEDVEAGLP